ncbi:MAG: hypothetical protein ACRCZZ_08595, partial [Phocaeicola sp.]
EEKHFVVKQYSDDYCEFHDVKNSEHGILHPSGSYVSMNKDGSVFIKGVKNFSIHDGDGNISLQIDFETGDIVLETKGSKTEKIEGDTETEYKGNWSISVGGDASIESKGNTTIESKGDTKIKAKACTVEGSSEVTVKAPQCIIDSQTLNFKGKMSQGTVPPSGSGVLCALPACLCTGSPHTG